MNYTILNSVELNNIYGTEDGAKEVVMNYKFEILKKTFKDENGVDHEYPAYVLSIGGNDFYLNARAEDKKLLKYILEDNGFFDEVE